jgi:DNA end-binding protein Ku
MARAIWTGSLSFGLVSVPVGLFTATDDKSIHFNQFQAGTSDRVRNKRVNESTGEEVAYSDIVKGYDLGDGQFVILTPEELEAVEPGRSREIAILDFVDLDDIDPVFYRTAYYLAPHNEQARRAYALLREAMEESRKVGIATFVMRGKQYLVAVRPEREVIGLETMFFADEVRDPAKEIEGIPVDAEIKPRELETAKLLIDSMATAWDPSNYQDTYRKRVEELIEQKSHGKVVATAEREPALPPVVDLMEALRASVAAAGGRRSEGDAAASASGSDTSRSASRRRLGHKSDKVAEADGVAKADGGVAKATDGGKVAKSTDGGKAAKATESKAAPKRSASPDPRELSKSELYDRATELGVPGRSKMSRKELEMAISGGARRRAS